MGTQQSSNVTVELPPFHKRSQFSIEDIWLVLMGKKHFLKEDKYEGLVTKFYLMTNNI